MRSMQRTRFNLSLRTKILGIASVPIVILILTTATFLTVLAQETRAERAAAHSVAVRQATHEVHGAFQAANGAIWGETFGFGSGSGLADARADLASSLKALRALTAADPVAGPLLTEFEAKAEMQFQISQKFVEQIARTGRIPKLSADVLRDAETLTMSPEDILDTIERQTEAEVIARSEEAEAARKRVVTVVIFAGALGTFGGIVLIVFAMSRIVGRIRKLGENAQRLADGHVLMPFPSGGDEVGAVARELEEAARLLAEREEAMRKATDDAKQANTAKSEFLSRMSHELRTPLNSILGFGQMLEMSALTTEGAEDVEHILRAGRHLLVLIDEVLDISGIEAGAVRFSMEPVCVEDVFEEVVSLTKPIAEQSSVTVSATSARNTWVKADRQRLKQVMLNLVANAIKYNRPGGDVGLNYHRDGDALVLDVSDTGRGLSPADIERLFIPFERLGADQANIQGTGLGLTLSKSLVEGMGGDMSVRSEPDVGSVFSVTLQATEAPLDDVGRSVTHTAREASDEPVVLYVEDNLANLRLIERVLSKTPVRLISAMKGTLGVELAGRHRPDVILLDLHLPDISGEEVLRRLRADVQTADIPVIIISADATPQHAIRSMETAAYLTKPLDVAEFMKVFESVLASRAAA